MSLYTENFIESVRVSSYLHMSSGGNESKWSPSQEEDPEINAKTVCIST